MAWQLTVYSLMHVVAAVVSFTVAGVAWRHRDERGGPAFTVLIAGAGTWAVGDALQIASTTLELKLLFRTVGYFGHNVVAVSVLAFALAYTGRRRWVSRRTVGLLALEPAVVALVVTPTNALGLHDLLWRDVGLTTVEGVVLLSRSYGPWYWVNTAYNYALVVVALLLLVRMVTSVRGAARMQGVTLVAGSLPPFLVNMAWAAGLTVVDYTPVAFIVTGIAFGLALFRYRLLDLTPVARDTVLDAMRDGYVVLDAADRVVDLNATARRLVDVDAGAGTLVGDALPAAVDLVDRHALGDGGDLRKEVRIDTPDGPRHFSVRVSSLDAADAPSSIARRYSPNGRLVFLRDVTDRRAVEHRYQALIEGSSDMIAVLDPDGTFTYVSPSSQRILGYAPATLEGTWAFDRIHPDDREAVRAQLVRCVDDSREVSVEYRFERADGTWVDVESRARNLLSDPVVSGVVVNSRDVTDRVERERALEAQNNRLDKFTSVVSHDLRNPLNVIAGRVELARETGDEEHLDAVERAADRMSTLIDDLLTLSRQGETVDDASAVDLRDVASYAWSNVDTDGATLSVADDVRFVADRERLAELFENLFRNAVEHGSTGRRAPSADADPASPMSVRVGACDGGFYVEDDGPGIPPDDRERVFDHGYSTSSDGTGFGLSIVEEIVQAHGWSVAVAAGDDGGARFEIVGVDRPALDA